MNTQEAAALVGLIAQYQPQAITPEAAVAWREAVDEDVDFGWAMRWVKAWAGKRVDQNDRLMPGHLNRAWLDARSIERSRRDIATQRELLDSHCGRGGCVCTHSSGCYKGWIDGDNTHRTSPCHVCRPALADALAGVAPPGSRNESDWSRIRGHSALT